VDSSITAGSPHELHNGRVHGDIHKQMRWETHCQTSLTLSSLVIPICEGTVDHKKVVLQQLFQSQLKLMFHITTIISQNNCWQKEKLFHKPTEEISFELSHHQQEHLPCFADKL
jgi:hypothetical protein